MRLSIRGLLAFALTATVTVIVGLAIYYRLVARVPKLASVVSGSAGA